MGGDSFLNLDVRWKLLVLVADSATGKSSFAESLFERPFMLIVEAAEHLDVKAFEQDVHDGLAFDNVNSWGQLLRWRAVLQARNAKSSGGQLQPTWLRTCNVCLVWLWWPPST